MGSFSRDKILLEAWKIVKENLMFFVGFILFVSLINITPELILRKFNNELEGNKNLSLLMQGLIFIVQLGVGYLVTKIPLLTIDGLEINKENIFTSSITFFNYTIGTAIYGITIVLLINFISMAGSAGIIFVFPLIFIILKFQFVNYLIIDKKVSVMSAFRISNQITKDELGDLFLFIMFLFLLNLLGAFIFLVGLLLTLPISIVSIALIYRELIKKVSFKSDG